MFSGFISLSFIVLWNKEEDAKALLSLSKILFQRGGLCDSVVNVIIFKVNLGS